MFHNKELIAMFNEEIPLVADAHTTIIADIKSALLKSDIKSALLKDWCRRNKWSNFQLTQDGKFYAVPPGEYSPVLLPKEALVESDRYQELVDIKLREIRFLKRTSKRNANIALGLNVVCVCLLYLRDSSKNTITSFIHNHFIDYMNAFIAFAMTFLLCYGLLAVLSYWKYCHCKKKLIRLPELVDLLISLDNSMKRV